MEGNTAGSPRPKRKCTTKPAIPASDSGDSPSPPPTKRGRGRPPGTGLGRGQGLSKKVLAVRSEEAVPTKRKRGRPAKSQQVHIESKPSTSITTRLNPESARQEELTPWRQWGPYMSERQWGTVREDLSLDGNCWDYFSHDAAAYRAYRWGEDGLFGFCDQAVNICLSLALWNGKDSMLKERLFGLTANQGNHGEDVKELYYYLDAVPSHSYQRMLYKYPQSEFPYKELVEENAKRTAADPEYELLDTGVFSEHRYWDVEAEYVKSSPGVILCRYTIHNRGAEAAAITVLPQACFRNTWSWENDADDQRKPFFKRKTELNVEGWHEDTGTFQIYYGKTGKGESPTLLFTNNETNTGRLNDEDSTPMTKDAFHSYIIKGDHFAVSSQAYGSKVGALYTLQVEPGSSATVQCVLCQFGTGPGNLASDLAQPSQDPNSVFHVVLQLRKEECSEYYNHLLPTALGAEERSIATQAYAGLLWTKQLFYYDVHKWLEGGDPKTRINQQWRHMVNKDIISMPDKWEFPWYATWDLAFHMVPFGHVDIEFAKDQLLLFLSDRYMHPNGQLPAYEFNFSDVNPPVHAWACLNIYHQGIEQGNQDNGFLKKCFHRLLLNFNWWVNSKSVGDSHLYAGGFLGMDNITAVERSHPPEGTVIKQADGTGWMAFYSLCMLQMALQLAEKDDAYVDIACRFLDTFVVIAREINGQNGLWNEEDHFYYDNLDHHGETHVLKVRSLVGLLPLVASTVLPGAMLDKFCESSRQFRENLRKAEQLGVCRRGTGSSVLLSVPTVEQVKHLLKYMLSDDELLSPYGIRSLSKIHKKPFTITINEKEHSVHYCPGEGDSTDMFGGNSNWRGPVWICLNYLLIEALRIHHTASDPESNQIEYPTASGKYVSYGQVADDIAQRIIKIFLPDKNGHRPVHGSVNCYAEDPHWKELILFNEYFHGDNGKGCGASHQTGWTALVVCLLRQLGGKEQLG